MNEYESDPITTGSGLAAFGSGFSAHRSGCAFAKSGLDYRASLKRWRADGVRLPDGKDLPAAAIEASFLRMDGDADRTGYLVYPNFRTIMTWNRSTYFALCVGLLSDLIETG